VTFEAWLEIPLRAARCILTASNRSIYKEVSVKKILLIGVLVLVLGAFVVGCATKSDEAAVEDSIRGLISAYNAEDYDKCMTYLKGITDETEDTVKAALAMAHGFVGDINVDKVENVTVNGSTATARVTFRMGDETDTSEMTLTKVDGKWKMAGNDVFSQD
jgi:hypothetical protein